MKSKIEAIYPHIQSDLNRTPLVRCPSLEVITRSGVYFKMENQQITGSFKLRGVLSKFHHLKSENAAFKKVVAASTGNHALAVCKVAGTNNVSPIIFVPENIAESKLEKLKRLNATIFQEGRQSGETEQLAIQYAKAHNLPLIHPYNDSAVIAGQGTIGLELHEQLDRIDLVFVPVGGGGLISGIALYLKAARPDIKIVGVQPRNASEMAASLDKGEIVPPSEEFTISDGTAGGLDPETITLDICRELVDEFILVEELEIIKALQLMEERI